MLGLEFVKGGLDQFDFTKLILIKLSWCQCNLFLKIYIKSDYYRINIIYVMLVKISSECIITKNDEFYIIFLILSFYFIFNIFNERLKVVIEKLTLLQQENMNVKAIILASSPTRVQGIKSVGTY